MDLLQVLVGFSAGLALAFVAADRATRRPASKIGDNESSLREALVELEREDPQNARKLREPPAVPVEDVPPSLTSQQQEELRNSPTPESRKERARRFIKDPDAADIIGVLAGWRPTRRRAGVQLNERDYEEKLIRFLEKREHGFNGAIERRPPAQWGTDNALELETRKAIPDLAIWSCPDLADRFDCLNQLGALVSNSMGDT